MPGHQPDREDRKIDGVIQKSYTDVISQCSKEDFSNKDKILNKISTVYKEQDLSKMLPIIEAKLNDEDCTAMELCAAFLKQQMGEDAKDIPTEDYFAERKRIKMEERRGRRERVERYRSERDGRRRRDDRDNKRSFKPSEKDIRRDGSVKERKGKFHFDMNEKPNKREASKDSFQKVKTLPQKKEKKQDKKPESKISMKEYSKRFKF